MGGVIVFLVVCGIIGGMVGTNKQMGGGQGFALGVVLGPLGVIIVAVSKGTGTLGKIEARPAEAGWHPDPLGRFDSRFWDGARWTQHVGRVEGDGTRRQLEDPV
jgi:hypothetical protein